MIFNKVDISAQKYSLFIIFLFCILSIPFDVHAGWGGAVWDWFNPFSVPLAAELGADTAKLGYGLATDTINPIDDALASIGAALTSVVKHILYSIMTFFGWFATIATGIFSYAINPVHIHEVLDSNAIKHGWAFVRDFFNIFFIFALLFSAFATIFQVEKFHLKRTLLMIVLMALLVNFSWPITRVIMDMGNVTMYFFANNMFNSLGDGGSILGVFGNQSNIADIIVADKVNTYEIKYLLAGILFTFMFAITLMAIAVLMFIRLIILGLLLVFAAIGFVLLILPSTQSYAHDWWNSLIKWTFMGPIMLFMLGLALNMMQDLGFSDGAAKYALEKQMAVDFSTTGNAGGSFAGSAALFIMPVIIMWASLIIAQKLGGSAAGMVVSRAGTAAKWGGNLVKKGAWKSSKFAGQKVGRGVSRVTGTEGLGTTLRNSMNQRKAIKESKRQQRVAHKQERGYGVGTHRTLSAEGAATDAVTKASADYKEKKFSVSQLKQLAKGGDAAAVMRLTEDKNLDTQDYVDFRASGSKSAGNKSVQTMLNKKVSEKNVSAIITADLEQLDREAKSQNFPTATQIDIDNTYNKNIRGMAPDQIAKQDASFHYNPKVQEEIAKKTNRELTQISKRLSGEAHLAWRNSTEEALRDAV